MSVSVIPSQTYSASGAPATFEKGRTAIESMRVVARLRLAVFARVSGTMC